MLATIRQQLDDVAVSATAAARRREIHPLRGIRGVGDADLAQVIAQSYQAQSTSHPLSPNDLCTLFSGAFEDGIVAIALTATHLTTRPDMVLDLAYGWLDYVDDTLTADALGSVLLGPATLASHRDLYTLIASFPPRRELPRRALIAATLGWLPEPLTGPATAALRQHLQVDAVRMVEQAQDGWIAQTLDASMAYDTPCLRKAQRRTLRVWGRTSPRAALAWATPYYSRLPKMLKREVDVVKNAITST